MITPSRSPLLLAALAVLWLPQAAAAQTARPLEVSAAYTRVHDLTLDVTFPAGWSVGVSKGVSDWLSIVGAYDDMHKTISTIAGDLTLGLRTVMAGGQASAKLGRATEFGQLLVGVVHASGSAFGVSEASTHFGVQAGGGLDYPLRRKVALRVELDYRVFLGDSTVLGRQFRTLAGVVFSFP